MKRSVYAMALCVQICLFIYIFMYGKKGWLALSALKCELSQISQKVDQRIQYVSKQKEEIEEWSKDPFYKEKIAREQLQMARPDDKIFYIVQ